MTSPKKPIAIIIPIYRDIKLSRECIINAISGASKIDSAIVVAINDASPEIQMRETLRKIQNEYPEKLILKENKENVGFVKTVNLGLREFNNYDIIILNNDAIAKGNWIERLYKEAYSDQRICTVTPLTNSGSFCSFPIYMSEHNENAYNLETEEIDDEFKSIHLPYSEAPTGVGFCMYIKRSCIDKIGYFDEERFNRGYGEENDFCQRAEKLGLTNIITPNIYIYHSGSASFGNEKKILAEKNLKKLKEKHRQYHSRISRFIINDPLKSSRIIRHIQIISASQLPLVLHVLHNLGGGVMQHVTELAEHTRKNAIHIYLKPDENHNYKLFLTDNKKETPIPFKHNEYNELILIINALNISFIHYHHIAGFPSDVLRIPYSLSKDHIITVHDFYLINRNPSLTGSDGIYRGTKNEANHPILTKIGPEIEKEEWLNKTQKILDDAKKIIFPTESTKEIFLKSRKTSNKNILVVGHPESKRAHIKKISPPLKMNYETINIGVLGALGREKGADLLERIATESKNKKYRYNYILIGYAYRKLKNIKTHGKYKEEELHQLIRREKIDLILFTAQCPETYSYTLSHALKTGLPIVAPKIGAFTERLLGTKNSALFDHQSTPQKIIKTIDFLLSENTSNSENTLHTHNKYDGFYTEKYAVGSRSRFAKDVSRKNIQTIANIITKERVAPRISKAERLLSEISDTTIFRLAISIYKKLPNKIKNKIKSAIMPPQ